MTGEWQMYANDRGDGVYTEIAEDRRYAEAHGLAYPIVAVTVWEVAADDPAATHWGWVSSRRDEGTAPSMIWPWKGAYEMCFPYGPAAEERAGKGRTVRLAVTPMAGSA